MSCSPRILRSSPKWLNVKIPTNASPSTSSKKWIDNNSVRYYTISIVRKQEIVVKEYFTVTLVNSLGCPLGTDYCLTKKELQARVLELLDEFLIAKIGRAHV